MKTFSRSARILLIMIVGLFFHYILPQQDVARVVKTEDYRTDFSVWNRMFYAQPDAGNEELPNRQIRLVSTVRQQTYLFGLLRGGEQTMVYRNEDTGWIWPPYFKFDSANLDAEAEDRRSTADEPRWVVIRHYGWRIKFLSVFPNAISIRDVDGPDFRPIPWFNIFFFIFLMGGLLFLRAMWRQFRQRSVDPLLDAAGDQLDEVQAGVAERKGRLSRWMDTWRSKDNKQLPPE